MSIKLNHIAIAVSDMEAGTQFWHTLLGLPLERTTRVDAEGVDVAFLAAGDSEIELLAPYEDNGVARFLEKRGPGIHHLCLEVEDINLKLAELRAAGVVLLNETPRQTPDGKQYAFIHPRSTGGVLVELYQVTPARQ